MDWFLYDKDLRHERVGGLTTFVKISIVDDLQELDYASAIVVTNTHWGTSLLPDLRYDLKNVQNRYILEGCQETL